MSLQGDLSSNDSGQSREQSEGLHLQSEYDVILLRCKMSNMNAMFC